MNTPDPVSADELLRLFDGELPAADARALQARLSAQDKKTLAAWQLQKEQLRALGQAIAAEATPPELVHAMGRTAQAHSQTQRWWRWGGIAASVTLAFGMGWLLRGTDAGVLVTTASAPSQTTRAGTGLTLATASFPAQAALAHATYTPEVKHPVEVSAEQHAHLVQWLSKRLDRPLQVPSLSAQGYELMGGRLLPGDRGARAQFMFQRADGLRVTLYVGAVDPSGDARTTQAGQASVHDTAFAFSQHGAVASFYWVDRGFGYALSAPVPQAELQRLAHVVYQQL
jgi:anti-sigma factor RsiW